jgi:hypothetical protein
MRRQLGLILVLVAPSPVAAQSVAGGFGPEVLGDGETMDMGIDGTARPSTADFDEDGRADIVTADANHTDLVRFLGQASGGVGERLQLPVVVGGDPDFLRAFAGDFTGDGHADALCYASLSGAVSVLAGHGDGTFAPPIDATFLPPSLDDLAVGDADEDGVLDLVWAAGFTNPHSIFWSPGLGGGTFAAPGRVGEADLPHALLVGDFTADGLPDVAALSDAHVLVFAAVGPGQFAAAVAYSDFAASSLAAADMDRDGHVDLVHASLSDVATILHGDAAGHFGDALHVSLGDGVAWDARPVDMDLDGFTDLVGAGEFPTSLRARRMQADGPIGPPHAYALPDITPILGALPADFDGDGLPDIATTGFSSHELVVSSGGLGPFVDFGFAVASAQGTPKITLSGTPAAGQVVGADVSLPTLPTVGLFVVGLQALDTPLLGSTFVPSVDAAFPVTVPGTAFAGVWPAGIPAGTPLYVQALFALQGGGKTISNAVMILPE